ncbi:DUF5131 family protein [Streptomyces mirabilis]
MLPIRPPFAGHGRNEQVARPGRQPRYRVRDRFGRQHEWRGRYSPPVSGSLRPGPAQRKSPGGLRFSIEWTEATWNPTTGCDRVSAGCDAAVAHRSPCRRRLNSAVVETPPALVPGPVPREPSETERQRRCGTARRSEGSKVIAQPRRECLSVTGPCEALARPRCRYEKQKPPEGESWKTLCTSLVCRNRM